MTQLIWLVTGCSSGFGEHLVLEILARGDRVIATGRQAFPRLQKLKDSGAAVLDLDVTQTQEDLDRTIAQALKIYGGLDVLINNAGYIESGALEELTPEILLRQLNTNLFGPINLTRSILPHFRSKKAGTIAFVGSQAGWRRDPGATSYCASKFALEGVVECLQRELPPFGIRSMIFEPGYYRTQALSSSNLKHEPSRLPAYADFSKASIEYERAAYGNEPGDPKKAAERMIDVVKGEGMAKGKEMPPRLPLGKDALQSVREKCLATLKLCEEWEEVITSTDIENSN